MRKLEMILLPKDTIMDILDKIADSINIKLLSTLAK